MHACMDVFGSLLKRQKVCLYLYALRVFDAWFYLTLHVYCGVEKTLQSPIDEKTLLWGQRDQISFSKLKMIFGFSFTF